MMKRLLALSAAFWLGTLPAYADSTIDALSASGALAGTENVPIFQTANPAVKTTAQAIGNTASALAATVLTSGTLPAARMPALTGDCVTTAGAVATHCALGHPGYIATNWYFPGPTGTLTGGVALAVNTIRCSYGNVAQKVTLSQLGAREATAGSNLQLAIYTSVSGRPGALIAATGSIDISGAAGAKTGALTGNKQVGPGGTDGDRDLWFCSNVDNAATVLAAFANGSTSQAFNIGTATAGNLFGSNATMTGISCAGAACNGASSTFGTWPTLTGSTWTDITGATSPAIGFLVNSVP